MEKAAKLTGGDDPIILELLARMYAQTDSFEGCGSRSAGACRGIPPQQRKIDGDAEGADRRIGAADSGKALITQCILRFLPPNVTTE